MPLSRDPEARARQLANLSPRPPAPEEGNQRAASHRGYGAVSAEERGEREQAIHEALGRSVPLKDSDGSVPLADEVAVAALSTVLVRLERVSSWLGDHGWLDDDDEPRAANDLERRLRAEALDWCRELGLTPRSRMALGVDLVRARDLAVEMAELERAEREGGGDG